MRLNTIVNSLKQKVFIYGTLKDSGTRLKALGSLIPAITTKVTGKVLDDGIYASISDGEGEIWGQVITLTKDELGRLDAWEELYDRTTMKLDNGEEVWVYIRKPGIDSNGKSI